MTRTDAALAVRLVTTDGPSLLPLVLDDRLHAKWGRERVSSQDPGQRARGWSCSKEQAPLRLVVLSRHALCWAIFGDEPIDFEKGSVESTHKVPTSHYLALALTK